MGTRSQHGGGNKPPFLSFLAACLQHKGALLHTTPTHFSQNWSSFQAGWRLSKQPQNPFCRVQPPWDGTKLFKTLVEKISSPLYFDGIAPLTHFLESSRQLLKTIAVRLFSTTFQSLDVFARIRCVLTFVFARIRFCFCICLDLKWVLTFWRSKEEGGTARSGACNDEKCKQKVVTRDNN